MGTRDGFGAMIGFPDREDKLSDGFLGGMGGSGTCLKLSTFSYTSVSDSATILMFSYISNSLFERDFRFIERFGDERVISDRESRRRMGTKSYISDEDEVSRVRLLSAQGITIA